MSATNREALLPLPFHRLSGEKFIPPSAAREMSRVSDESGSPAAPAIPQIKRREVYPAERGEGNESPQRRIENSASSGSLEPQRRLILATAPQEFTRSFILL